MAIYLTSSSVTRRLFFGTALLLIAGRAAQAETTSLICNAKGTEPAYRYEGPITVDLNEVQGVATVHYSGISVTTGVDNHRVEAHSIGPVPAKFDSNTITFSGDRIVVLNRLTGEAVLYFAGHLDLPAAESWNCHAAQKQF